MSRTQVSSERTGYGRGLILGLTMAETMLLLVFCLLLAVGAIIAAKDKATAQAVEERDQVQAELDRKEQELAQLDEEHQLLLASASSSTVLDEEWRELRLAQRAARKIVAAGLTLEEAVENVPLTKAAKDHGLTAETVAEMVQAAKAIETQGMTPEAVQAISASAAVLKKHGYDSAEMSAELAVILENAAAATEASEPHEWPPIINLSEAGGYTFNSGSAELTPAFTAKLSELAPEIAEIAKRYKVDVIEIIGHTDEQAMAGSASNMDRGLKDVLDGTVPVSDLRPADNAGLGLARAVSVASVLNQMPELAGVTILPLSGGQMILPGDQVTDGAQLGDVRERRRIEIRVRKRESRPTSPEELQVPAEIEPLPTSNFSMTDPPSLVPVAN